MLSDVMFYLLFAIQIINALNSVFAFDVSHEGHMHLPGQLFILISDIVIHRRNVLHRRNIISKLPLFSFKFCSNKQFMSFITVTFAYEACMH